MRSMKLAVEVTWAKPQIGVAGHSVFGLCVSVDCEWPRVGRCIVRLCKPFFFNVR